MSNSFIWPSDRTVSGATTTAQRGPGSNRNEGVLNIPQNSSTRASPSDFLVSYSELTFVTYLQRFSRCVFYRRLPRQLGGHITVCKEVFENNFSQIRIQMYNERNSLTTRHKILRVGVHFWIISSLIYICLLIPPPPEEDVTSSLFLRGV